jgi:hypothetical protein
MPRPRRKKPQEQPEAHIYTVWVSARKNDVIDVQMVYAGSSEHSARLKFAAAVMDNPGAISVDIRRDMRPWLRVLIERQHDDLP